MFKIPKKIVIQALFCVVLLSVSACSEQESNLPLDIPRGYTPVIELEMGDRILNFGPFVGYYFMPVTPDDLSRLKFVCFNERSFYTLDLPENTKLFSGEAVLQTLAETEFTVPADDRINPIVFADAPSLWLENRPKPQDEFIHFHSAYDALGSVLAGYWIQHVGEASFTYDMGGRVGPESVLYHEVTPGVDLKFAHIMEFDKGPALQ